MSEHHPSSPAAPASPDRVLAARERLDAWVREVVGFHFDPRMGTPFWIEYAKGLDWNPREEVRAFDDLARFGTFRAEWLEEGPPRRWVPLALGDQPVYLFETDAGAGRPLSRIDVEDFRTEYDGLSGTLPEEHFPQASDWIALAPTGPRRLRLALEHLAQLRGGICFLLDMDPRWVGKCTERGWTDEVEAYTEHVVQQALTILKAHPNIHCMFATAELLEALCEKISLRHVGITGVVCGPAPVTADFHRLAREELMDRASFIPSYGNEFIGLTRPKPFVPEDDYAVTYYAPQLRSVVEVVDPRKPDRAVAYGERGRVKVTALTKELFIPGLLQSAEATRAQPIALYPWDGIADVR